MARCKDQNSSARLRARLSPIELRLLKRQRILAALIRAERQAGCHAALKRADEMESAADALEGEVALRAAEIRSKELAEIEEALRKISEGTYGTCDICRNPISAARLRALPSTTLCLNCQRAMERNGHQPDETGAWERLEPQPLDEAAAAALLRTYANQ